METAKEAGSKSSLAYHPFVHIDLNLQCANLCNDVSK